MSETKPKKLEIVKVDPSMHKEIIAESARLEIFMYDVVALAWKAYKDTRDKATPRDEKIPPALRRYVDMLVDVLASQETDIILGVTANLDLFHELLRRRTHRQE